MRKLIFVLVGLSLLSLASPCLAGKFMITIIGYDFDPPTPTTEHGRVLAAARYAGSPDSNDKFVRIQTDACSIKNKQTKTCQTGFGYNDNNGPWNTGFTIACNTNECMGHLYVSKPCCGQQTVDFQGESGVVIYHQFNPDIDEKDGWLRSIVCKQCNTPCESGAGNAELALVLPIASESALNSERLGQAAPDFLLTRIDHQGGMSYLMDEWALLTSDPLPGELGPIAASSSFDLAAWLVAQKMEASGVALVQPEEGGIVPWTALVVMVPPHPDQMRSIPLPETVLRSDWLPGPQESGLLVVRADFGEDRSLQQLEFLYQEGVVGDLQRTFVRENLHLNYLSEKSHRTISYAVIRFNRGVTIESSVTLLPECCDGPPKYPPWQV